jgi:glycosyltransferase involved in cell wall biosynthesis
MIQTTTNFSVGMKNPACPKISIITPTYNQGQYIEQTIQSVINQNYPNLEYIIIDGGSTDNTVEIIKKYEKHLKFWVSEKDKGQANAINKGLKYCSGEIFNWINSDDYLENGALFNVAKAFSSNVQMVAGKVRIFNNDNTIEYVQHSNLTAKGLMFWLKGVQFVQPGVWIRKDLIQKCGGINETYHYSFDWDLYIRYLCRFNNVKYIEDQLIHFRYHNDSKTVKEQEKFLEEQAAIIKQMAQSGNDRKLKKLAESRIYGREWRNFLEGMISDSSLGKRKRAALILDKISKKNTPHWRATAGALRRILIG